MMGPVHAGRGRRGLGLDASMPASRLGRRRDWLVGGGLLVALLVAVTYTVGWQALLAPWRTLSPSLIVALVAMSVASYLLRALRFYDYFRPRLAGRFPSLLRLTVLHNTANNLLPMRAGELVFPWLMRRYFGHGLLDAMAALLWVRLLDLHLLALAGLWILSQAAPSQLWLAVMVLWLALLVPLAAVGRIGALRRAKEGDKRVLQLLATIAAAAPTRPVAVARLYLLTALIWGLKLAAFAILLRHFVPVDVWRVLSGVIGAELSSVLPFHGIAGAGSYEAAAVAALVPLGVDPALALSGAVNLHLFLLGVTLLLALSAPLLPAAGARPGRATRRGRDRQSSLGCPAEDQQ